MSTSPSVLAEIMWQAALAVGHHAKSSPKSAIYEGCIKVLGKPSYDAFTTAINIYGGFYQVHVISLNAKDFDCAGPSWQMWLSKDGRNHMANTLLFCYEYIITEMSGDRVEIPPIVTRCNANQTAVHPESVVV